MTGGETTRASSTLTDMFMKVILSFVVSFVVVIVVVDICLFVYLIQYGLILHYILSVD